MAAQHAYHSSAVLSAGVVTLIISLTIRTLGEKLDRAIQRGPVNDQPVAYARNPTAGIHGPARLFIITATLSAPVQREPIDMR